MNGGRGVLLVAGTDGAYCTHPHNVNSLKRISVYSLLLRSPACIVKYLVEMIQSPDWKGTLSRGDQKRRLFLKMGYTDQKLSAHWSDSTLPHSSRYIYTVHLKRCPLGRLLHSDRGSECISSESSVHCHTCGQVLFIVSVSVCCLSYSKSLAAVPMHSSGTGTILIPIFCHPTGSSVLTNKSHL